MKKTVLVLFLLLSSFLLSACGGFLEDYSYSPVAGQGINSNSSY